MNSNTEHTDNNINIFYKNQIHTNYKQDESSLRNVIKIYNSSQQKQEDLSTIKYLKLLKLTSSSTTITARSKLQGTNR